MKKYLVGGAVRDQLLGRQVVDRDWVVVGETPESMLAQGFLPVGKDFPVFLHPETKEEYALARTERKTEPGYHGFAIDASPDVTLEQDLLRRDLTINAIAQDEQGELIDPYGGLKDIEARQLRHVSPAFSEDPVRVLRVARFYARYAHLGFKVATETRDLIRKMVHDGEVDALVSERVWQEVQCALSEKSPKFFFSMLRECSALHHLFPEIDQLFGVPQSSEHHPEVDTGIHTLMVLEQAASLSSDPIVRFAALTHDLGKGLTSPDLWPKHHGHEQAGLSVLDQLCDRLKVPNQYRRLAQRVMQYHGQCHMILLLRPASVVDLLQAIDAFRQPDLVDAFLTACEADSKGRMGYEEFPYPQEQFFRLALDRANQVDAASIAQNGFSGAELGEEIRRQRIEAVRALKKELGHLEQDNAMTEAYSG